MRTTILAGLLVLALAGGCGTALDRPDALARRAAATPSAQASSAPPFNRAALAERAKSVLMAPDAMVNVGVVVKPEDRLEAGYWTSDYCNLRVIGEGDYNIHVSHGRNWLSPGITVYNTAHGYANITGAAAVDATRRNAQNCATYDGRYYNGTVKYELLDVVDLGAVAGVEDSYGRCERRTFDNSPPVFACVAYLGRGQLLSNIVVYFGSSAASALAKLRQIVPIAAAALAAA